MRVNTDELKKMLSYVSKCRPNNLLEITNYYELLFNEDGLTITATDGGNFIVVNSSNVKTEKEQTIIVKSDQFYKLVNRTTVPEIKLEVMENFLEVTGNGAYKVEIVEGEVYPNYEVEPAQVFKLNNNTLNKAINAGKCAKSQSASDGVLFGYLFREKSIQTADAIKVCCVGVTGENIENQEFLISPNMASLLTSLDKEIVKVSVNAENTMALFEGDNVVVAGPLMEGANTYPNLGELLFEEYPQICEVDTQLLIQALDRLELFVGLYDKGIISVAFLKDTIVLTTSSKSTEAIHYTGGTHTEDIAYSVNGRYFYDLVTAVTDPTVSIHYGTEGTIKLESTEQIQLLATAEDDE